jgi:hypothetical protein
MMHGSASGPFSAEELAYLRSEADDFGWYVWTPDAAPIIEALCARGLMAANGDFKIAGFASGRASPSAKYFELIGAGKAAFIAIRAADDLQA